MGFGKNVDAIDAREAATAGSHSKPLTAAVIAKHLAEVRRDQARGPTAAAAPHIPCSLCLLPAGGLDQMFTLHHRMRGLSGGQKVKVVLGAAMWQNLHILVLDGAEGAEGGAGSASQNSTVPRFCRALQLAQPRLARALAGAIRDFGCVVVIISHNREFTVHLCKATWHVAADGRMTPIGKDYKVATVIEKKAGADEFTDAVRTPGGGGKRREALRLTATPPFSLPTTGLH